MEILCDLIVQNIRGYVQKKKDSTSSLPTKGEAREKKIVYIDVYRD